MNRNRNLIFKIAVCSKSWDPEKADYVNVQMICISNQHILYRIRPKITNHSKDCSGFSLGFMVSVLFSHFFIHFFFIILCFIAEVHILTKPQSLTFPKHSLCQRVTKQKATRMYGLSYL